MRLGGRRDRDARKTCGPADATSTGANGGGRRVTRRTPQDIPDPESVSSTPDLSQRPSRAADYTAESSALVALAQAMAISPNEMLQELVETALACATRTRLGSACWTRKAGVSLDGHCRSVGRSFRRWYAAQLYGLGAQRSVIRKLREDAEITMDKHHDAGTNDFLIGLMEKH